MSKPIDIEAIVELLRRESREWNEKSVHVKDVTYRSYLAGIASGYGAAASDIAAMIKKQAEGSVPADELNSSVTSES
jgi:hypothetical protein